MLPEVKDCADDFGITDASVLGAEIRSSASPVISRRP